MLWGRLTGGAPRRRPRTPPPAPLPGGARAPPRLVFPEDRLISKFFRRNPPEVVPAIALRDAEPYYARRLALKQLELMEEGKSEAAAYEEVAGQRERELRVQMGRAALHQLQLEEERILSGGLERGLGEGSLAPRSAEPHGAGVGAKDRKVHKARAKGKKGAGPQVRGKAKEKKAEGGKAPAAKKPKEEAKEEAKKPKQEAKKPKEEAKKPKQEAKKPKEEAKHEAKEEAKKPKEEGKEEAKKPKGGAGGGAKGEAPTPKEPLLEAAG